MPPRVITSLSVRTRVMIAAALTMALPVLILADTALTYVFGLGVIRQNYAQPLMAATALAMLAGTLVAWDLAREVQRANARWRDLSLTDELTGVYNRRYWELRLSEELARARRYGQSVCLLLIDVDRFKEINDRHGHDAGDKVLRTLCEVIQKSSRQETALCRFGGDEFAIVLPQTPRSGGLVYADRVRATVSETPFPHGGQVTISIGLGAFAEDAAAIQELFKAADASLYAAKQRGRNRVGG